MIQGYVSSKHSNMSNISPNSKNNQFMFSQATTQFQTPGQRNNMNTSLLQEFLGSSEQLHKHVLPLSSTQKMKQGKGGGIHLDVSPTSSSNARKNR